MAQAEQKPYRELTEIEEVEEIMAEGGPAAIIDFWSPTCGPCLAMMNDFDHVASQFDPEEVQFCKVNIATHGFLAAPFNVRSTPTILLVHGGNVADAIIGRTDAATLGRRSEWLVKKASKRGLLSRLIGR